MLKKYKIVVVHYPYMLIRRFFCLVCEYIARYRNTPELWSDINFVRDSKFSVLWPRHV